MTTRVSYRLLDVAPSWVSDSSTTNGPSTVGASVWMVPTQVHSSAAMSPAHPNRRSPLGAVERGRDPHAGERVAQVGDDVDGPLDVLTGVEVLGGPVHHDDHGAHASVSGEPGLRPPPAEHRPRDRRWPSAKQNWAKPPVGRYLSRRSVSTWWRARWPGTRCVARPPLVERGEVGRAARAVEHGVLQRRGARSQPLPVEVGPALGLHEVGVGSGTAWAPNSLTKRTMRGHAARRSRARSRSSPWYQPK